VIFITVCTSWNNKSVFKNKLCLSPVTYDKLSIKEGSLLGNGYVLAVSKHLISSIHKYAKRWHYKQADATQHNFHSSLSASSCGAWKK